MPPRVIRDNATLFAEYEHLSPGDIFVGRLRVRTGEEHLLLDLADRRITFIPSAISQLCSRSKVFQTRILGKYMIPGTTPVYDRHDILSLVNNYGQKGIDNVVCKLDRANGGQGVLLFSSAEEIFTHAVLGTLSLPCVVQPFIDVRNDIRAVILGNRIEAYTRNNPDNFRHNLHCGGSGSPYELSAEQLHLCREVMDRAGFPYACIDLLVDSEGKTRLSEINLRGGLRGAMLTQQEYLAATEQIHEELLDCCLGD